MLLSVKELITMKDKLVHNSSQEWKKYCWFRDKIINGGISSREEGEIAKKRDYAKKQHDLIEAELRVLDSITVEANTPSISFLIDFVNGLEWHDSPQ